MISRRLAIPPAKTAYVRKIALNLYTPPGGAFKKARGGAFSSKANRTSKLQCKGRQESLLRIGGVGVGWGLTGLEFGRCPIGSEEQSIEMFQAQQKRWIILKPNL
jgi:hypothetical protein